MHPIARHESLAEMRREIRLQIPVHDGGNNIPAEMQMHENEKIKLTQHKKMQESSAVYLVKSSASETLTSWPSGTSDSRNGRMETRLRGGCCGEDDADDEAEDEENDEEDTASSLPAATKQL